MTPKNVNNLRGDALNTLNLPSMWMPYPCWCRETAVDLRKDCFKRIKGWRKDVLCRSTKWFGYVDWRPAAGLVTAFKCLLSGEQKLYLRTPLPPAREEIIGRLARCKEELLKNKAG